MTKTIPAAWTVLAVNNKCYARTWRFVIRFKV